MNYPPGMTLRPLDGWPKAFTSDRKPSRFEAKFSDTLELLGRELRMIDPDDRYYPPSVLQIALREQDLRRTDGMPRVQAVTAHPGVILNIEPRNRPAVSFPCDTFTHWHGNLRAIALTLEPLRKIDRYGVADTGQQYRGWQAIEAPQQKPVTELVAFLAAVADEPTPVADTSPENLRRIHRRAQRNAHPDRNSGSRLTWNEVEHIADQLRRMGWL
ncbi:molecular chaperone DnaJ [Mycobacterium sp. MYCO198283]|uniref:molecular chaperone DnaJ n=1 Tax=Mycobacterium sp. MYCO198283 TaxID=2883505 RepID=UPI001E453D30|nr:molecular chaperone DnaJ [Mycobacterium sp. MYCO198283]MCG5431225.1 molecular chaperone DnaJ [Mycobacterium sp. MYCO198283]